MNKNTDQQLSARLNQHTKLRACIEDLLNVVENVAGDCTKADDAEQYVIEELRTKQPSLHSNGKKNSTGTQLTEKSKL